MNKRPIILRFQDFILEFDSSADAVEFIAQFLEHEDVQYRKRQRQKQKESKDNDN